MSQATISQHPSYPVLECRYLEEIAIKKAQLDTGKIQGIALSCLEEFVHFVFSIIFYIFYPCYEQFYQERKVEAFAQTGVPLATEEPSCFQEVVINLHKWLGTIKSPESTTIIMMIRHGETHRNKVGTHISGQENGSQAQLNEEGRKQAHELGKRLAARYLGKIAAIYTSSLGRCEETAEIIRSYLPDVSIHKDPRLMEFRHGRYDTMSFKARNEICKQKLQDLEKVTREKGAQADRFFKWRYTLADLIPTTPDTAIPSEGEPESALEVFERGSAVIEKIGKKWPAKTVLAVTHAGFIKTMGIEAETRAKGNDNLVLPMYYEPAPAGSQVLPGNCSVTHFEKKAGQKLTFVRTEDLSKPS